MLRKISKVKGLKISSKLRGETYYWGETLNGKPHGHGYSETFETHKLIKKRQFKLANDYFKLIDKYERYNSL